MIYQDRRALARIRNAIVWLGTVTVSTMLAGLIPPEVFGAAAGGATITLLALYGVSLR